MIRYSHYCYHFIFHYFQTRSSKLFSKIEIHILQDVTINISKITQKAHIFQKLNKKIHPSERIPEKFSNFFPRLFHSISILEKDPRPRKTNNGGKLYYFLLSRKRYYKHHKIRGKPSKGIQKKKEKNNELYQLYQSSQYPFERITWEWHN